MELKEGERKGPDEHPRTVYYILWLYVPTQLLTARLSALQKNEREIERERERDEEGWRTLYNMYIYM